MTPLNLPKKKKFMDIFYVHKENNEQYKVDCDKIDGYNTQFEKTLNVLWYPSAGQDFRPINFLSQLNIQRLHKDGVKMETPQLFVYSCLGPEVKRFVENYRNSNNEFKLYEDLDTKIESKEFIPLEIIRGGDYCNYNIDTNFINENYGIDPLENRELSCDYDAFFMKGQITHKQEGVTEDFFLLYFFQENINFFHEVLLKKKKFDVQWLCTDREGCGMGGCLKSMITHIYVDNKPDCFRENGFKPQYIIPFTDFTLDQLRDASERGYIHLNRVLFINPVIYHLVYRVLYQN